MKRKIERTMDMITLIIVIMGVVWSSMNLVNVTVGFMIDYHNIDLVHNVLKISNGLHNDFNDADIDKKNNYIFDYDNIYDQYKVGKQKPISDFYVRSRNSQVVNFKEAIAYAITFGASIIFLFLFTLSHIFREDEVAEQ